MALHFGFFDAVMDEDTYKYDREYNADDFTGYFGEVVGSGVCIHNNENSMKVSWVSGAASVAPGYLFIRGYWLKNTARYSVKVTEIGTHAIIARLVPNAYKIEITTTPKASPEQYPDSLVLGYVTRSSSGSIKVEDTRYRTDICGVIDSAGSLSNKVQFALNYIDNEIEDKLAEAEDAINAQSVALDKKIAEVNEMVKKLAPPPIGTVKFSASDDVGEGWLPCDGSFITKEKYPKLVEVLGGITPIGAEFVERLRLNITGANISNLVMHNKKAWVFVYSAGSSSGTLYGVDAAEVLKVSVSGVSEVTKNSSVETVLSICGDRLFLSQAPGDISYFVLLQSSFTGAEKTISMNNVSSEIRTIMDENSVSLINFTYPQVTYTGGAFYLTIGYKMQPFNNSEYTNGWAVYFISWDGEGISNATVFSRSISYTGAGAMQPLPIWRNLGSDGWRASLGFHEKNGGELVIPIVFGELVSESYLGYSHEIKFSVGSVPAGAIGDPYQNYDSAKMYVFNEEGDTEIGETEQKADLYYQRFETNHAMRPKNLRPIVGDGICLWSAYITSEKKVEVTCIRYQGDNLVKWVLALPEIPSRAKVFPDSFCYTSTQNVWFIFLGTGLLFSLTPDSQNWGYMDTTSYIGVITSKGTINYDKDKNALYIGGLSSDGTPKVARLQMDSLFDFSGDGAWLPLIASDGIPAYIKALEV